jgi:hypothetical protein
MNRRPNFPLHSEKSQCPVEELMETEAHGLQHKRSNEYDRERGDRVEQHAASLVEASPTKEHPRAPRFR